MKSRSDATEVNLDSLLDTVTNVVGILVLVLVLLTLNIQKTVERIREEYTCPLSSPADRADERTDSDDGRGYYPQAAPRPRMDATEDTDHLPEPRIIAQPTDAHLQCDR